jgi:hypothetical protein
VDEEAQETEKVLVLYPFQMLASGKLEFRLGLQAALQKDYHPWVDFAGEYLDLANSAEGSYLDKLLGLLRSKYANHLFLCRSQRPKRCPIYSNCQKFWPIVLSIIFSLILIKKSLYYCEYCVLVWSWPDDQYSPILKIVPLRN